MYFEFGEFVEVMIEGDEFVDVVVEVDCGDFCVVYYCVCDVVDLK